MDGVIYLNVGQKHLRNLAVSLHSLRAHYSGPVTVLSGDEEVTEVLDDCKSIEGVTVQRFAHEPGRNQCYYAKTSMHRMSPYERTIFLDSDTVIHGDISPLWPTTEQCVIWTQFADWHTQMTRIQKRIHGHGWPELFPKEVAYQTAAKYPALNTGVIGFSNSSFRVMDRWNEQTAQNIGFICDEICAQLLAFEYPHNILDHRFNASPRFSYDDLGLDDLSSSDVRIVHSHGNKGLKCGRVQQELFIGAYFDAWNQNVLEIHKWDDKINRGKKHPSKFMPDIEARYYDWCEAHGREPKESPRQFRLT